MYYTKTALKYRNWKAPALISSWQKGSVVQKSERTSFCEFSYVFIVISLENSGGVHYDFKCRLQTFEPLSVDNPMKRREL